MTRSLARATYLSLGWHLTSDALPLSVRSVLLLIYFLHKFPFCFIICTKSSSTSRPSVNYQHAQQGTTAIYLTTWVPVKITRKWTVEEIECLLFFWLLYCFWWRASIPPSIPRRYFTLMLGLCYVTTGAGARVLLDWLDGSHRGIR